MRRHFQLLQEPGVWIFEIDMRNAITTARESRSTAVVHAEKGGFLAALIHLMDEVEEIRFSAAKRIVEFVAIQDAHDHRPVGKRGPEIAPQRCVDFAGDYRMRQSWPPPRVG